MDLPASPSFRLDGKRAMVAGASSGIGLGAAVSLARAGAEVTLVARRPEPLQALRNALTAEGCAVEAASLDVTDIAATSALVEDVGPFEVLVNAAGLARHGPALDTDPADYDAVFAVNTRAAYFLAQAVAKSLVASGRTGSLITISSQMGHVGGIDRAVYAATKHALEGMTKSMAIEWGQHGIRVNTLCPTFIRTPLTEPTFANPDRRAWIEEKIKLGRAGTVEDIMGPVLFLASDASALVTGTAILVDGGWTAD